MKTPQRRNSAEIDEELIDHFITAARDSYVSLAVDLLDASMPVNKAELYSTTRIMWAAIRKKNNVMRLLLQKSTDMNK